jgi:hypothetical protein
MRTKLVKILYNKFGLNVEIENKLISYKNAKKKFRNQNNKNQIGKLNTINLNLMMKLKANKTFTKRPRKKI